MRIDSHNDASALGTAVHKAMQSVVGGLMVDVGKLAAAHNVDADDLGVLVWYGRQAWAELAPSFPGATTEQGVAGEWSRIPALTGHIDVIATMAHSEHDEVRILDWKSGRIDGDYRAQLLGYALCIFATERDVQTVTGTVVWLREQDTESYVFRRSELGNYISEIRDQLARVGQYTVGGHCDFCPRRHSCPALAAQARADVALLGGLEIVETSDGPKGLEAMPAAEKVRLFKMSKVIASQIESFQAAVRREAKNGPIDGGDGTEIRLVPEKGPRKVDNEKAWPILLGRLDDAEVLSSIKVNISAVEKHVMTKAGRGKGTEAKRELNKALDDAQATSSSTVLKLKVLRKTKGEIE
jgi:hypothetical protein